MKSSNSLKPPESFTIEEDKEKEIEEKRMQIQRLKEEK